MKMNKGVVVSAVAALACAGAAKADIVNIAGSGAWGSYNGTLDYTPGPTGTLVVSLTNTSGFNGKLTGLLFNIAGINAVVTNMTLSPSPNWNWGTNQSGAPFGTFEAGSWLGGNWEGGGNPNLGILSGNSGIWSFDVSGLDAPALSAADFTSPPGGPVNFIVRMRGFDNGQSDKVPGHTPTPGALALFGLAGAAAARRRR